MTGTAGDCGNVGVPPASGPQSPPTQMRGLPEGNIAGHRGGRGNLPRWPTRAGARHAEASLRRLYRDVADCTAATAGGRSRQEVLAADVGLAQWPAPAPRCSK